MLGLIRAWRRRALLRDNPIPPAAWQRCLEALPLTRRLDAESTARLRDHTALFLREKSFSGAHDLALSDELLLVIAAQACLPILNFDFSVYDDWETVIVYPAEFVSTQEYVDEAGVVHVTRDILIGEAWLRGPLIVSADDVRRSGELDGVNVVIHECAHKLDMLNGDANGHPPLHRDMRVKAWSRAFQSGYDDFVARLDRGEDTEIDPYAGENPAEFFAVLSETFFERPGAIKRTYPDIYDQLRLYYRQDPAASMITEYR